MEHLDKSLGKICLQKHSQVVCTLCKSPVHRKLYLTQGRCSRKTIALPHIHVGWNMWKTCDALRRKCWGGGVNLKVYISYWWVLSSLLANLSLHHYIANTDIPRKESLNVLWVLSLSACVSNKNYWMSITTWGYECRWHGICIYKYRKITKHLLIDQNYGNACDSIWCTKCRLTNF